MLTIRILSSGAWWAVWKGQHITSAHCQHLIMQGYSYKFVKV